jgi:mannose-6-phosphate isomerase-like protein (cupin superfamily)
MIKRGSELPVQTRSAIRGGQGEAHALEYLSAGEMAGVEFLSVLTLEPGASIGVHEHPDTEELYLILAGEGEGVLDGESFPVAAGDAWLTRAGHSHGLRNGPAQALQFLAV